MHMIARGREDFLFAVELGELLHQHIGMIPAGGVGIRDPARAQKAEAIHQEFHVARQRALSQQIGFRASCETEYSFARSHARPA